MKSIALVLVLALIAGCAATTPQPPLHTSAPYKTHFGQEVFEPIGTVEFDGRNSIVLQQNNPNPPTAMQTLGGIVLVGGLLALLASDAEDEPDAVTECFEVGGVYRCEYYD